MNLRKRQKQISRTSTFVTLGLLFGFLTLWQFQLMRERTYLKNRVSGEAERVELEIAETMKQTAQALQRYASRVELLGSGNKAYLEMDSRAYLKQLPILKRIGLINKYNKVYWSYPPDLSAQVQGLDESFDHDRVITLNQTRERRMPAISRAIELKSGGLGFFLPIAIFPQGKFGGYVYATIQADRLFHSFVPTEDFQVAIFENGRAIFQSQATRRLVPELTQNHEMKWADSDWRIEITPTEKFVANASSALPSWILFSGILVSLLIGWLLQSISTARNTAVANTEWRKALINSSDYGIISTDVDGLITTFNQAAVKMLGYGPDEVIGQWTPKIFHVKEEIHDRAEKLSVEMGRKIEPGFETFTAKAKNLRVADENEWTFVRKDKSTFPAHLSVTSFSNAAGEVVGYLGICADLTEKKKAQAQLSITSERLQRVVEATEEGIWEREFIPDGKILFIDSQAKKIFGFAPGDELSFREVAARFTTEEAAESAEKVNFHIRNKTAGFEIESKIKNPAEPGKVRWIRARGKVVGEAPAIPILVSTVKDVTEEIERREQLKKALAAAEEATQAKSDFLANMSHEIRTPLNGVIGMAGLLLDSSLGAAEREYAETVRDSAEILLSLINDILDFSKIEARKLDLEIIDFDFDQVTQNIERLLHFSAQKKGLQLVRLMSPAMPTKIFKGDPNRIGQILANLISNAIKFTMQGQVTITISCDAKGVPPRDGSPAKSILRVEVTDTGIGMSRAALGRMFQPFSQADASTSRRFGGTGLGLSICKHLTEMMGGEIGVRSEEGVGSTFWFTLALERGEILSVPASPEKPAQIGEPTLQKIRILLAEDNTVNQLIARKMLEKSGFRVDVVANGNEVLDALALVPYDLVLMDCQMPELDGYEATLKIRAATHSPYCKIPIIAMTANAMSGDREKCLAVGMDDYVTKPIKPADLAAVIRRVLVDKLTFKSGAA